MYWLVIGGATLLVGLALADWQKRRANYARWVDHQRARDRVVEWADLERRIERGEARGTIESEDWPFWRVTWYEDAYLDVDEAFRTGIWPLSDGLLVLNPPWTNRLKQMADRNGLDFRRCHGVSLVS